MVRNRIRFVTCACACVFRNRRFKTRVGSFCVFNSFLKFLKTSVCVCVCVCVCYFYYTVFLPLSLFSLSLFSPSSSRVNSAFQSFVVFWIHILDLSGTSVPVLISQSADDVVDSQQHARAFHRGFQGLRFDFIRFPDA